MACPLSVYTVFKFVVTFFRSQLEFLRGWITRYGKIATQWYWGYTFHGFSLFQTHSMIGPYFKIKIRKTNGRILRTKHPEVSTWIRLRTYVLHTQHRGARIRDCGLGILRGTIQYCSTSDWDLLICIGAILLGWVVLEHLLGMAHPCHF